MLKEIIFTLFVVAGVGHAFDIFGLLGSTRAHDRISKYLEEYTNSANLHENTIYMIKLQDEVSRIPSVKIDQQMTAVLNTLIKMESVIDGKVCGLDAYKILKRINDESSDMFFKFEVPHKRIEALLYDAFQKFVVNCREVDFNYLDGQIAKLLHPKLISYFEELIDKLMREKTNGQLPGMDDFDLVGLMKRDSEPYAKDLLQALQNIIKDTDDDKNGLSGLAGSIFDIYNKHIDIPCSYLIAETKADPILFSQRIVHHKKILQTPITIATDKKVEILKACVYFINEEQSLISLIRKQIHDSIPRD